MTQRQRLAIVRYWLSKNWSVSRRRLIGRYFVLMLALILASAGQGLAKDSKGAVTLMSILDSKKVDASAEQAKKEAAKKEAQTAQAAKQVKVSGKAAKDPDIKTIEKTVTGAAMFVRRNKMSVEFNASETEAEDLLLTLDPGVKVKGIKDLLKIGIGDQVSVKYTESYKDPKKKGDEPTVISRVGTEVTFVKKAEILPIAANALAGVAK